MNTQKVTLDVEVPDGWKVVAYDRPSEDESFLDAVNGWVMTPGKDGYRPAGRRMIVVPKKAEGES